jgi:hypothetical protein
MRYKITKTQLSEENFKEKENWSWVPDGRLTPRLTGRLTVGRNVTSTSKLRWRCPAKTENYIRDLTSHASTNPQLSKNN